MKFFQGFQEEIYKSICKKSGSKQAVKDASFMRPILFRGTEVYAERIDCIACIFGYFNKTDLHIVCVAVDASAQKKGYGSALLERAMQEAKKRGLHSVKTRTTDGYRFYSKFGFAVTGKAGKDMVMEALL